VLTHTAAIRLRLFSATALAAEAARLGQPIYWAGPARGVTYELTGTSRGERYVRYLPSGAPAGVRGGHFPTLATYLIRDAFTALTREARGNGIEGPDGSIIFADPRYPNSVYMAFPSVDAEIEIYNALPGAALRIAESGDIRPVG